MTCSTISHLSVLQQLYIPLWKVYATSYQCDVLPSTFKNTAMISHTYRSFAAVRTRATTGKRKQPYCPTRVWDQASGLPLIQAVPDWFHLLVVPSCYLWDVNDLRAIRNYPTLPVLLLYLHHLIAHNRSVSTIPQLEQHNTYSVSSISYSSHVFDM